ncbi:xylulokinase [Ornatilinea apprima]|uniref:xylulokinase n=1 Tax=Ornatilinea apprima TaxID=1134406 RepID=UPI0009466DDD|nr:FGGY family carbohydrate kinase [Ornatilinea apprima]
MQYVISYDLGTGGLKAGLYRIDGTSEGFIFHPYQTYYPKPDWHEQRPLDWWDAVCISTRKLIQTSGVDPACIAAVAASGHSLVSVPIGQHGELLVESVPIWSDRRAKAEATEFFAQVDYQQWYMTTGNGDPPETYAVFKLMWLKKHCLDIFSKTKSVLGSKDYINYCLTGQVATDYSYASGSGVFELENWRYSDSFIDASGLSHSLFIEPKDSYSLVGRVTPEAAEMCGLCVGTEVICGGVDNSCMALGTTGIGNGRVYTSLGSSAWIAVSSNKPILDPKKLPFVFAHVERGYYTSAVSIFAAANTYRWAKENFCPDLSIDPYNQMNELAAKSPVGANGIMFNPSMAGGSSQEPSEELQGAFFGLKLSNARSDILRAILEGVAFSLNLCLKIIDSMIVSNDTMIICGGGAKSDFWMQIFADIYNKKIIVANVDQDAASLGAAAIAIRGAGFWQDYAPLDTLFQVKKSFDPIAENRDQYSTISKWFLEWITALAIIHDNMKAEKILERMEREQ